MKILIVTKNWLGDGLFQIPAIERIKSRFPESEITCMTPSRCREIFEAHPAVDKIIIFDEKKEHRFFLSRLFFAFQLKREHFDRVYLFHRSRTRAFVTFLAGIKERIGFSAKGSRFLTQAIPEPGSPCHQVDYFLELLEKSGLNGPAHEAYHFHFYPQDEEKIKKTIKKNDLHSFICFHLGANWEPKRWPVSYFARLADLIFEKWSLPVVLTGSTGDMNLAKQMMEKTQRARVISVAGQLNLRELGALYKKALFVVSGDSGPMHIAAGVGTPVVGLFGPTDPKLTGPHGPGEKTILHYVPAGYTVPWYGEIPKDGWLSHIQPEEVMAEISKKNWVSICQV